MIDLASHIEYLLMSHDCVVAPGLGAFLVHETPAFYDADRGRFMPPVRVLGFNQAVTLNDGLLAESVARKRNITLDAARGEVEAAVASFRHQLASSASLPVGNLGEMSLSDGTLIFEPSQSSAVALRYRGLMPLAVRPLVVEQPDNADDVAEEERQRPVSIPMSLKVAASVILLMVACGIFFTTDSLMGDRQANFASLDSGLRSHVECPARAVAATAPSLNISREIELNIAVPDANDATAQADTAARKSLLAQLSAPAAEPQVALTTAPAKPGRYILVVGSFPSMKSARKHIGDDSRLAVAEMDGKYRVYAASASTNAEAHTLADSLRDEFPSVWICRR